MASCVRRGDSEVLGSACSARALRLVVGTALPLLGQCDKGLHDGVLSIRVAGEPTERVGKDKG
jgi:hypothetical protein